MGKVSDDVCSIKYSKLQQNKEKTPMVYHAKVIVKQSTTKSMELHVNKVVWHLNKKNTRLNKYNKNTKYWELNTLLK